MPDTTFIYGLVDPRNNQVRYVGKSDYPRHRLQVHRMRKGVNRDKDRWLEELEESGLSAKITILEEVPKGEWKEREFYWIQEIGKSHPLLNKVKRSESPYRQGVQLVMTKEEKSMLQALAEANTGDNVSKMIRQLVKLASRKPKTLGLHPPKVLAPSLN